MIFLSSMATRCSSLHWRRGGAVFCAAIGLLFCQTATAQDDIDQAPINYSSTEPQGRVAKLQEQLDSGEVKFEWDERLGWLPSLLEHLGISPETQTLVFSKTSLQVHQISPRTPRALYYNDDAYVGYVPHGDLIEVSDVDPQQGAIFYALEQHKGAPPKFVRDQGQCLACHHDDRTRNVPGYLVRSVYPDRRGYPILSLNTEVTDPTTPFSKRFGGWYVSGEQGPLQHLGNALYADEQDAADADEEEIQSIDFSEQVNTSAYLRPRSDLIALMVLEHQTQMHNAITRASYEARQAAHYDKTWNEILKRPADHQSDVSVRRLDRAAKELVETLLFSGEAALESPISGSEEFINAFAKEARRDSQVRSLRDLDLQTRLLKYPCSYLIYSESFAELPESILSRVKEKLAAIFSGKDNSLEFAHLNAADREALSEILRETMPDFF